MTTACRNNTMRFLVELFAMILPAPEPTALSDSRYRVRSECAKALERGYPYSDPWLRAGMRSKCPEVRSKCESIRSRCVERVIECPPWADWPLWVIEGQTWGSRFPLLRQWISSQLQPNPDGAELWTNYRIVSWNWGRIALLNGVPPSVIRGWFAIGCAVDRDYYRGK